MTDTLTIVGATGHRPQHLSRDQRRWAQHQANRIAVHLRMVYGCTTAVSGLALGWDTYWARAALWAGLDLWVHIPFEAQPDRWTSGDRAVWRELRGRAVKETVYGPNPTTKGEAVRLLHARNGGMVDVSDAMTCLWFPDKRAGGTWHAVQRVAASGKPAIHLDPALRTVRLGLLDLNGGTK